MFFKKKEKIPNKNIFSSKNRDVIVKCIEAAVRSLYWIEIFIWTNIFLFFFFLHIYCQFLNYVLDIARNIDFMFLNFMYI